ncbi:MAG: GreA/GreB family elongation factor [Hyphomicrobiales bacterium]|nr:GreA/GreB family elongation factor [Hyphomicrobiales bacterium]
MSSAFTRENDDSESIEDIGERPVSQHRNLVTPEGLAQIEHALEAARVALAKAENERNRRAIALAARDLNYWSARRANAELVQPIADKGEVRFGHTVVVKSKSGDQQKFTIVGEDQADPTKGLIPHVAPLAKALIGKEVGDSVEVKHQKAKIVAIS